MDRRIPLPLFLSTVGAGGYWGLSWPSAQPPQQSQVPPGGPGRLVLETAAFPSHPRPFRLVQALPSLPLQLVTWPCFEHVFHASTKIIHVIFILRSYVFWRFSKTSPYVAECLLTRLSLRFIPVEEKSPEKPFWLPCFLVSRPMHHPGFEVPLFCVSPLPGGFVILVRECWHLPAWWGLLGSRSHLIFFVLCPC